MDNRAYRRECPHLYRGVVESNIDPTNLGRCKVRVPSIHGELAYPADILPWARPLVLSPVGDRRGTVNIPNVGDIVWVLFEGASRDCPVYFGGTYAEGDLDIDTGVIDLLVEGGDRISYRRTDRTYTIKVGENSVEISPTGVSIIGDTNFRGDVSISGTLTVDNIFIKGSCNKECDCP